MIVIPAIDLKDKKVVRLTQGDADRTTVYGDDPAAAAQRWLDDGAKRVHIVDLDGAFAGEVKNREAIERIVEACHKTGAQVQVGGGIRTPERAKMLLDLGVAQVIVGTAALETPDFLKTVTASHPDRVILSVDARGEEVAVHGWKEGSGRNLFDTLASLQTCGLSECFALIYTDISRDGTLQGPNIAMLKRVVAASPVPVIAAGGIATLDDLKALRTEIPTLWGVVTGKAIYHGSLSLKEALEWSNAD